MVNESSFIHKYKKLLLLIIAIAVLIPVFLYLFGAFEPTPDEKLNNIIISNVESHDDSFLLLESLEEDYNSKIRYIENSTRLLKSLSDYRLKRAFISQEEYDKEVQEHEKIYRKSIDHQNQLYNLRVQYVKGEIGKKEFLERFNEYKEKYDNK